MIQFKRLKKIILDRRLYGLGFYPVLFPLIGGWITQFFVQIWFLKNTPVIILPYSLAKMVSTINYVDRGQNKRQIRDTSLFSVKT